MEELKAALRGEAVKGELTASDASQEIFGSMFKRLRQARGLTLEEVAETIRSLGKHVTKQAIDVWEDNASVPGQGYDEILAAALALESDSDEARQLMEALQHARNTRTNSRFGGIPRDGTVSRNLCRIMGEQRLSNSALAHKLGFDKPDIILSNGKEEQPSPLLRMQCVLLKH